MAEPTRGIKAAIVGCGRISMIHIAALRALPDVEIVAVCDANEAVAGERARSSGVPRAYTDVGQMLSETTPDVVHILTPPVSHFDLVRRVVEHGAHAYVEKPLASNETQARAMLDAAKRAGVTICPGHNRLFDPIFLEAVRRVREGEIGRVLSVRAEQGFSYESAAHSSTPPWSYTGDWGIFENLMPHPLYLAGHFLETPGDPQVTAFNPGGVREAAVEEIHVLIPSRSAVAEVTLSLNQAPETNRVEIAGTRGRMLVDLASMSLLVKSKGPLPSIVSRLLGSFDTSRQLITASLVNIFGIVTGRVKRYPGIRRLVTEFYESVRNGGPPPVSAEQGLLNVRQLDKIKEACRAAVKRRVELDRPWEGEPPRVLVTGASGFVGGHLVRRLSAEGVPCRATARIGARADALPGVQWVKADLRAADDLRKALRGVETVYHCAAQVGSPGSLEEYERANVEAVISVADLAAEAGVQRIVYLSSIGVYAMPAASPYVEEDHPYDPRAEERGFYTQTKLAADRALIDWGRKHDTPRVVLLRPGTIYGPGAPLPVGRLPLLKAKNRPVLAGSRRVAMPLTFVGNVVDAMLAAARCEAPGGSVFNIVDAAETDQAAVAVALGESTGGRLRPVCLPYPLVWPLMLALDLLGLVRHRKLGTARYRLARTLADMRYRCGAARRDLEWQPRVDLRGGLSAVLAAEEETPFPH